MQTQLTVFDVIENVDRLASMVSKTASIFGRAMIEMPRPWAQQLSAPEYRRGSVLSAKWRPPEAACGWSGSIFVDGFREELKQSVGAVRNRRKPGDCSNDLEIAACAAPSMGNAHQHSAIAEARDANIRIARPFATATKNVSR